MYRYVSHSLREHSITTAPIFHGVYSPTSQEEDIFTIWHPISWTFFRKCSDVYSKQKVIQATVEGFIRQKILSVPALSLLTGLPGSGSWCFVAHESAKEDRIEIIGDKGMICFSVFTYDPIALHTERGREEILPQNPPYVQLPLIQAVVEHLQGKAICTCDGVSATPTNWVMDRILNKL